MVLVLIDWWALTASGASTEEQDPSFGVSANLVEPAAMKMEVAMWKERCGSYTTASEYNMR